MVMKKEIFDDKERMMERVQERRNACVGKNVIENESGRVLRKEQT